jgi:hypothetical protein
MAMAQRLLRYRPARTSSPPPESQKCQLLLLNIAVASVCHQINWDVLTARLTRHLGGRGGDMLRSITNVSTPEFQKWFDGYDQPDRVRAEERARMLREVGRTMERDFGGDPMSLFERSHFTLAGINGFLLLMDQFSAFREDPLRKKTNVLTHEIVREGIARFTDERNIAPAIDYHLIRLYLRTGRVYSLHNSITEDLTTADPNPRPRLVRVLRESVADAIRLTAQYSSLTIPDVNYIEWQLGRSTCVRGQPACLSGHRPRPLAPDVATLFEGMCPYTGSCYAFQNPPWMELQEPVFSKTFY